MTSIERTAYPRFGRVVSARELDALSPLPDEVEWARRHSRSGEHLLGLVLALKCFQRLGYFPRDGQPPEVVVERVRGCLGLPAGTTADAAQRTAEWQRELVRDRVGAVFDQALARSLAEQAIREEAQVKNHPPDLINVALEVLVRESLELPGFSTLNEIAARVRAEVNAGMFSGIFARMTQLEVLRTDRLLGVGLSGKSEFDALKRAAGKASWSNFRGQVAPAAANSQTVPGVKPIRPHASLATRFIPARCASSDQPAAARCLGRQPLAHAGESERRRSPQSKDRDPVALRRLRLESVEHVRRTDSSGH